VDVRVDESRQEDLVAVQLDDGSGSIAER